MVCFHVMGVIIIEMEKEKKFYQINGVHWPNRAIIADGTPTTTMQLRCGEVFFGH